MIIMACERSCYTEPTFDYAKIACFLKEKMHNLDTGMKVVVMMKDKFKPRTYRYVQKSVMYFIPNDLQTSSTIIAYVAPGHDNNYNYMYLLSKRLDGEYNVFAGDHFTMGLRDGKQFDLHYTSYDYTAKSRPSYLYYDLLIKDTTSPSDITRIVCSTSVNNKQKTYDDTLTQRCYFFDNLMKYVHNSDRCNRKFNSEFNSQFKTMYGGKKRKTKSQKGGIGDNESISIDEIGQPFQGLIKLVEDKIGGIPNLESVEMHIINDNKGIITYCLDNSNVESVHISSEGVQGVKNGSFMTYYSLPFDFATYEFISIEELVGTLDKTFKYDSSKMRFPLKDLVLCDDKFDYGKIVELSKAPTSNTQKCRNTKFKNSTILPPMIPTAGGKSKKKDNPKSIKLA